MKQLEPLQGTWDAGTFDYTTEEKHMESKDF